MCGSSCMKTFSLLCLGVLKFWFLQRSGLDCVLAVSVRLQEGSLILCWGTQSKGPAGRPPECAGDKAGHGVEQKSQQMLETTYTASEADNHCKVLHQMRIVLKKTFSLWFREVVPKFWFLNYFNFFWIFNNILKIKKKELRSVKNKKWNT